MGWTYIILSPGDYREGRIEITGAKYHHLVRVRRLSIGTQLRAALPDGRILLAEISSIADDVLCATVNSEEQATGVSPCRITLYQAVLKGEKMDFVVQKATELGVTTLVPLLAKRSVPQWTTKQAEERAERWQRIADAAAEQSERSIPMQVEVPCRLVDSFDTQLPLRLLLHERQGMPLPAIVASHPVVDSIGVYIGPEGGWAENETAILLESGVIPVHLGGRILRAETASLAVVTLAQYLWGDLGTPSLEAK